MRTAVSALVRAGAVLILVLGCTNVALAQYSGNVQGVISDSTGAAINGATVTLRNTDTAVTPTITSSDSGNYRFSSLRPGPYVISAEANNFQKKDINVALGTSETKGVNVTLPRRHRQSVRDGIHRSSRRRYRRQPHSSHPVV